MWIDHNFFTHSSVNGHFAHVPHVAVANRASVNVLVQGFVGVCFGGLGPASRRVCEGLSQILKAVAAKFLNSLRAARLVSTRACRVEGYGMGTTECPR